MKWLLLAVAVLAVGFVVLFAVLAVLSQRPPELGLRDGRLLPCRYRSNCVSTEDTANPRPEAPFAVRGDPEAALDRLARIVAAQPRTRIIARQPGYLRAEFRSRLFRFVDDLEARVDPATGVLQVRSGSRVGRGDHGVNRARIQELRLLFEGGA